MQSYLILRRSAWKDREELDDSFSVARLTADEEMEGEVQWLRSYVLDEEDGTLGTLCVYQAEDEDAIMEHATRSDMPADEIIAVYDTIVMQDDP